MAINCNGLSLWSVYTGSAEIMNITQDSFIIYSSCNEITYIPGGQYRKLINLRHNYTHVILNWPVHILCRGAHFSGKHICTSYQCGHM